MKDRKRWIYAMYKEEKLLSMGTSDEICKEMGISKKTFCYYRTKNYEKRINNRKRKSGVRVIIRVED